MHGLKVIQGTVLSNLSMLFLKIYCNVMYIVPDHYLFVLKFHIANSFFHILETATFLCKPDL